MMATSSKTLLNVRGKTLYRLMSACAAFAWLLYGYDAAVLGGVQATEPFLKALGYPTGVYVIPMVASSYTLAAAVCSFSVGTLFGMRLGRRKTILLGDALVIVGASIQASSWSVAQIIVGRVLCGFGTGCISSTVPTYMAEMGLDKKTRGPEIARQCIWLMGGIAGAYWLDFGFAQLHKQVSWRFPIAFQAFFATISGLGLLFLPDTPRWYFAKGREDDGDNVLVALFDKDISVPDVQAVRNEIIASLQHENKSENELSLWHLVWDRTDLRVGRRIRIGFLLLSFQQFMGINIIIYYSTSIFSQIGLSPFMSQLLAALMNSASFLGSIPVPWTIEKFGRRPILLWGGVACTFWMMIYVIMVGLPIQAQTIGTQWTAVTAAILFNLCFGYGWVAVVWLYPTEVAPLRYRHLGNAAAAFGSWTFSFVTVFGGGIAIQNVGWKIWIWPVLSCAVAVITVYFMCPETTGKTLEELDILFAKPEIKARLEAQIQHLPDAWVEKTLINITEVEKA